MRKEQAHMLVDALFDLGESILRSGVPAEAGMHFMRARREALLGIRAAVDAALARQEEGREQRERTTPIPVEE